MFCGGPRLETARRATVDEATPSTGRYLKQTALHRVQLGAHLSYESQSHVDARAEVVARKRNLCVDELQACVPGATESADAAPLAKGDRCGACKTLVVDFEFVAKRAGGRPRAFSSRRRVRRRRVAAGAAAATRGGAAAATRDRRRGDEAIGAGLQVAEGARRSKTWLRDVVFQACEDAGYRHARPTPIEAFCEELLDEHEANGRAEIDRCGSRRGTCRFRLSSRRDV